MTQGANEVLMRARDAALESERLFTEFVRTETDDVNAENGVPAAELARAAEGTNQAFQSLKAQLNLLAGLEAVARTNASRVAA